MTAGRPAGFKKRNAEGRRGRWRRGVVECWSIGIVEFSACGQVHRREGDGDAGSVVLTRKHRARELLAKPDNLRAFVPSCEAVLPSHTKARSHKEKCRRVLQAAHEAGVCSRFQAPRSAPPICPLHARRKSCLIAGSMNLPERRTSQADSPDARPGIRPRPIQSREGEASPTAGGGLLHFSCPACLRMISAAPSTGTIECPLCDARVMPPQVVAAKAGKSHLPPPTKTGRLK